VDLPERYRTGGTGTWFVGSGVRIEGARVEPPAPVVIREAATEVCGVIDLKDHLSSIEIGLIRKALDEAGGTVAEAARLLKIRRTTLVEKLRKYHLSA